jgi:hypothetical protein
LWFSDAQMVEAAMAITSAMLRWTSIGLAATGLWGAATLVQSSQPLRDVGLSRAVIVVASAGLLGAVVFRRQSVRSAGVLLGSAALLYVALTWTFLLKPSILGYQGNPWREDPSYPTGVSDAWKFALFHESLNLSAHRFLAAGCFVTLTAAGRHLRKRRRPDKLAV